MQYEPRKLDLIAAKLGTSTAALEQYLQLKQREAVPPKSRTQKREMGKGGRREMYLG